MEGWKEVREGRQRELFGASKAKILGISCHYTYRWAGRCLWTSTWRTGYPDPIKIILYSPHITFSCCLFWTIIERQAIGFSFVSSPKQLLSFLSHSQLSKDPCQSWEELLLFDGRARERGVDLWQCLRQRSRCVSVRVCAWVLLATLHVIATDLKVADHPNCVFTHFIIYHTADQ